MMLPVCAALAVCSLSRALRKQGLRHLGLNAFGSISVPIILDYGLLFLLILRLIGDRAAFTKCCQDTGFLMVFKCREENAALKECLTGYYTDPAFYKECESEYLKQREEYRTTGIRPSQKQQRLPTSM
nr:PREDICTED: COX assembly mitochondrial protein homolog isoform X1 [Anolis carolinensis]|eukprot:XP_008119746.1 PREDICTED: COX assembly mitochondrial protein homolog isoform X1 [Anolis carolinensis]